MEVTKSQISHGVARFIHEDMIPHIEDNGMRFVLGMIAGSLETSPQLLDKLLENEMVFLIAGSGSNYDLGVLKQVASSTIEKYGKLTVTVPGIKFISPEEKVLQFGKDDIQKLVDRIEGR